MNVIIDPADDILYKSFYIYALTSLFRRKFITFSNAPFQELSCNVRNSKSMRFIIEEHGKATRYCIHCNDSYQIIEELYDWCDVYGHVNANKEHTDVKFYDKLISLCPSFAIRCWNFPKTCMQAVSSFPYRRKSIRNHIGRYGRLLKRVPYSEYGPISPSQSDYVFTCSTLWKNDEWNKNDDGVNLSRANFIRACKSVPQLNFKGGLVCGESQSSQKFADCLTTHVGFNDWLKETKKSTLVFNTPAFWKCHGWKLGEYLAMGKAILSTPLFNDLPAPLIHGEHIHIVENSQEAIRDAVCYIMSHSDYRQLLERNAYDYWQRYGSPQATLKLLGIKL